MTHAILILSSRSYVTFSGNGYPQMYGSSAVVLSGYGSYPSNSILVTGGATSMIGGSGAYQTTELLISTDASTWTVSTPSNNNLPGGMNKAVALINLQGVPTVCTFGSEYATSTGWSAANSLLQLNTTTGNGYWSTVPAVNSQLLMARAGAQLLSVGDTLCAYGGSLPTTGEMFDTLECLSFDALPYAPYSMLIGPGLTPESPAPAGPINLWLNLMTNANESVTYGGATIDAQFTTANCSEGIIFARSSITDFLNGTYGITADTTVACDYVGILAVTMAGETSTLSQEIYITPGQPSLSGIVLSSTDVASLGYVVSNQRHLTGVDLKLTDAYGNAYHDYTQLGLNCSFSSPSIQFNGFASSSDGVTAQFTASDVGVYYMSVSSSSELLYTNVPILVTPDVNGNPRKYSIQVF